MPSTSRAAVLRRRLLRSGLALVAGVRLALVVYHPTVQPGAALGRLAFQQRQGVRPPPGFAQAQRTVIDTPQVRVAGPDAPAARMTTLERRPRP